MYAHIRGEVAELLIDRTVIDTNGVGYELFCSGKTLNTLQKGKQAKLCTHLHLADDIMALYGFADETERAMFRRLISVTRVGPKLALAVLSALTPADVAAAIVTDNVAALTPISGMGKKTAQRVLLELKEKVQTEEMIGTGAPAQAAGGNALASEAVAALVSLGYDGASASRAVMQIQNAETIEEILKQALRSLAKN